LYIIEWCDSEGNQQQRAFDAQEAAQQEADRLEAAGFGPVGILWETEV